MKRIGRKLTTSGRSSPKPKPFIEVPIVAEHNPIEQWRPVLNFEGIYSVSNFGRVRRNKPHFSKHLGMVMGQRMDKYGYLTVILSNRGIRQYPTVHKLVAHAFLGPRPDGATVNHKDGNKLNNLPENLEYITAKENSSHASKLGLMIHGKECHSATLAEEDISTIRKRLAAGESQQSVADYFGVQQTTISKIKRNITWKHVH